MKRWPRPLLLALLAALLLSGCAAGYRLDNQVQSFSGLQGGLPANPTYTFERLPSQANQPSQAQLEALADPALFAAGLRRDDVAPRYSVQVTARVQRVLSPWADPWDPWWGWGGFGYAGPGAGFGWGGPYPRMDQAWFEREVGILVRELAGGRVVYETRASSDGPWLDPEVVLPAMFQAALQGFPTPPVGPRRVDIQIGGQTKAVAAPSSDSPAPPSRSVTSPPPAPAAPARAR
ncbi:DUF4136 domain-containing protein [Ramlibacter tataouinensis]|uniref:DUF4136 domain-containing protein n=1 Tax=Ramlibacter tataouinensis TaxID=94132 RepID=UPI0022F3BE74|nr:DUF4136 domain-containing protein [Ramlibacter tataouinensis]WBY03628.1 DUF4136 domain-containing protein [Ramlibacter tataouinensis]